MLLLQYLANNDPLGFIRQPRFPMNALESHTINIIKKLNLDHKQQLHPNMCLHPTLAVRQVFLGGRGALKTLLSDKGHPVLPSQPFVNLATI